MGQDPFCKATPRYKAIYDTMPVEQQQENEVLWYTNCFFLHDFTFGTLEDCDWIKEQDNAREDMEVRDI